MVKKKRRVKTAKPKIGVRTGDCRMLLPRYVGRGTVDLAFADPPYNIKYDAYEVCGDKKADEVYIHWMNDWMREIYNSLSPTGSFWLAMNDEHVAQARMIATQHPLVRGGFSEHMGTLRTWKGFHLRSWCVWYYTFGVACTKKFARSHTHLLWFTKNKTKFTFNKDNKQLRHPSSRQLLYNDKRANPDGKLPDDTWIYNPLHLETLFTEDEDTWLASRVCGTFSEREDRGEYGGKKGVPQMPEVIMDRIITACGTSGGLCIDPFLGNGTTGVSAVRQGMNFWGCDLSADCVKRSRARIQAAVT